jgi:hypothetical protein
MAELKKNLVLEVVNVAKRGVVGLERIGFQSAQAPAHSFPRHLPTKRASDPGMRYPNTGTAYRAGRPASWSGAPSRGPAITAGLTILCRWSRTLGATPHLDQCGQGGF